MSKEEVYRNSRKNNGQRHRKDRTVITKKAATAESISGRKTEHWQMLEKREIVDKSISLYAI